MSTALKPCPFCGSSDVVFEDVGNPGEFHDYAVTCNECGAFFSRSTDGEVNTKKEVAAAWNKRSPNRAGKNAVVLPVPCTNVDEKEIKDWFQKINEELDEFKAQVLQYFEINDKADFFVRNDWPVEIKLKNTDYIAEEAADTITAITSMLESMGIDEGARQAAQREVNEKNRERGRF